MMKQCVHRIIPFISYNKKDLFLVIVKQLFQILLWQIPSHVQIRTLSASGKQYLSLSCLIISFHHHIILFSSCPPPLDLCVLPVSPSLSSLSSMLRAWKVPGLSVRCSIFCRALVAGTVPQKVSCFQFPLLLFSVYSSPPFLSFPCLLLFLVFFVGVHHPPLCFSLVLLTSWLDVID